MSETKKRILKMSRDLFNEFGYGQVTIRTIALKLGMSSGNLNYHFKKREEILEALYFEMVKEFDQRIKELPQIEISFEQIKQDIQHSMERMMVYKFIWTDLFNLLKGNPKILVHFHQVYEHRIGGNLFLFSELQRMKLMRSPVFGGEYQLLAERMVNFGDTWIYTSETYNKSTSKECIENQVNAMLALIFPYLTSRGMTEMKSVVPKWLA